MADLVVVVTIDEADEDAAEGGRDADDGGHEIVKVLVKFVVVRGAEDLSRVGDDRSAGAPRDEGHEHQRPHQGDGRDRLAEGCLVLAGVLVVGGVRDDGRADDKAGLLIDGASLLLTFVGGGGGGGLRRLAGVEEAAGEEGARHVVSVNVASVVSGVEAVVVGGLLRRLLLLGWQRHHRQEDGEEENGSDAHGAVTVGPEEVRNKVGGETLLASLQERHCREESEDEAKGEEANKKTAGRGADSGVVLLRSLLLALRLGLNVLGNNVSRRVLIRNGRVAAVVAAAAA